MKPKHLFWGVLFISIGILILLNNYGSIGEDWSEFWKLWPLILVLWGIGLLVKNNIAKSFIAVVAAILLAVSVFSAFAFCWNNVVFDEDGPVVFSGDVETTIYSEPYYNTIKNASLNIKAGAGSFNIKDTTGDLLYADAIGIKNNYSLSNTNDGTSTVLNFKMRRTGFSFKRGMKNKVNIKLNPNAVWNLNCDLGAASINFDLSPYKTENIQINMGAASLKIKLGDLSDKINLDVDAGASSIDILIPESSGCEIKADAKLSSKNFEDFNKIDSELYRTNNFESAAKRIFMNIDAGVSSIKVHRYSSGEYNEWE